MIITSSNIIILLLIINIFSLLIMFWDKKKSQQRGARRISERTLFLLALFLGGIGIYAGMFLFRHKTQKWYFVIGMPLLVLENLFLFFKLFFK